MERPCTTEKALVSPPIESQGFHCGPHWTPTLHVQPSISVYEGEQSALVRVIFLMLQGDVTSVSIFLLTLLILQNSVLPRDSL